MNSTNNALRFDAPSAIQYFESKTEYDPEDFKSGLCAAFGFALASYAKSLGHDAYVSVMIRMEVDEETNEEFSQTFSHCIACIDGGIYDIGGDEADERWMNSFDDSPDKWGLVNDWEFKDFDLNNLDGFYKLCSQFNVSMDKAEEFKFIFESMPQK